MLTAPLGETPRPLVVLVPGGLSSGETYFGGPGIARRLAGLGYAVALFDPEGRGRSEGREDYGGEIHQASLALVLRTLATLPGVRPSSITVAAFCWGTTMALGALAGDPSLPVSLLIDWEGPADRADVRAGVDVLGWKLPAESQSDEWWVGREAIHLIGLVEVPYQRVEGRPNHLRVGPEGCLRLANAAADRQASDGKPAWTRLNGNAPNSHWGADQPPRWLPRIAGEVAILPYLAELVSPAGAPAS